ncbi:uncharacterized protein [Misgurnus anguillicaudatus]|uniref:uncharacterized protein isoform X1 n=1 Tax=Misgurnus anguillicaudatus TaxID=75329 RepID=UPI003CCF400C
MACKKMSYWTMRRKAKAKVDKQLQSLQESSSSWEDEFGGMHSDTNTVEDDEFMDCLSYIDEPECVNTASSLNDSESDTDSDTESEMCNSLQDDLATWATNHKIPHVALNSLLGILRQQNLNLPKDARTLLGTVRSSTAEVQNKAGGQYYHFGLLPSLSGILQNNMSILRTTTNLELQVNIDGLPLYKSSTKQFWPILCTVQNLEQVEPVTVGLFCGASKPNSLEEYLGDFICEIQELSNGFEFEGINLTVQLTSMVCDAPARAFLKSVKGHTGYHGCERCIQDGVYLENRMTFPRHDMPLRTNDNFREKIDSDHHLGTSPLERTSLDMVYGFPLDYMHLVCLGVMRRLLLLWLRLGPLTCRLSGFQVSVLTKRLLSAQASVPMEFARKPRALKEIDRWKATEFRQFLLYTGPVMLKDLLNSEVYKNFLLFFVGIFILCNDSLIGDHIDYANEILHLFVTHFGQLYGPKFLSYNVHSLIHLAEDAKHHGVLDNFSAFKYEDYLNKLKRLLRKPTCPLSQIVRRFSEMPQNKKSRQTVTKNKPQMLRKQHAAGPLPESFLEATQYKELTTSLYTIKLDHANSFVYMGGKVAKVQNIISLGEDIYIAYSTFNNHKNFFEYPLPSSALGIHLVDTIATTSTEFCKFEEIEGKAFLVPCDHYFVSVPLLHTQ